MLRRKVSKREKKKYEAFMKYCKYIEERIREVFAPSINGECVISIMGTSEYSGRNPFNRYRLIMHIDVCKGNPAFIVQKSRQSVRLDANVISFVTPCHCVILSDNGNVISSEKKKENTVSEGNIEKLIWLCQDIMASRTFKEYRIIERF